MSFEKKSWSSGNIVKKPYVVVDGVEHEVQPATVEGGDPITPDELNRIENGIEEASQTGGILTGSIVAYDGDTIPEGYEEVEGKNFIMLGMNAEHKKTVTGAELLPLSKVLNSYGNKLTYSNNGVLIGKGVSKVKVSANVRFTVVATSGLYGLGIGKHPTNYDTNLVYITEHLSSGSDMGSISASPYILNVNEGDLLTVRVRGNINAVVPTSNISTYFLVEEM